MRKSVYLAATFALLVVLGFGESAQARLFWQTFGSVASDGACGCHWNANQDFFVPRHADSCRYGLFSPCKTSCSSSPAAKHCHPYHPGYCSNYGPWHYCWRNLVYGCYCGCSPLKNYRCGCHWLYGCRSCRRAACGCSSCGSGCCMDMAHYLPQLMPAPNVEAAGMHVIGGLPIQGDEVLASMNLNLETGPAAPLAPAATAPVDVPTDEGILPTFGIPTP